MTEPLSPATISRLEKAALDNGFDQEAAPPDEWLAFKSTQCPLRIWLSAIGEGEFLAAFSRRDVAEQLAEHGYPIGPPFPAGALAGRATEDIPGLHRMLRRAFQLGRTLPNELLHEFEKQVAMLPRSTEAERLVVQRVGQNVFRAGLIDYWEGRCAITGLAVVELLRASHIKPWAECATDEERLDVFNGLLLAPHLDAAFDAALITVAEDGTLIVSKQLDANARNVLSLDVPVRIRALTASHQRYLAWHRERRYRP